MPHLYDLSAKRVTIIVQLLNKTSTFTSRTDILFFSHIPIAWSSLLFALYPLSDDRKLDADWQPIYRLSQLRLTTTDLRPPLGSPPHTTINRHLFRPQQSQSKPLHHLQQHQTNEPRCIILTLTPHPSLHRPHILLSRSHPSPQACRAKSQVLPSQQQRTTRPLWHQSNLHLNLSRRWRLHLILLLCRHPTWALNA